MQITTTQAEKAMSGNHTFGQLGLSMMMLRLKRMYDQSPTPEILKKCTDEINSFLKKYEKIVVADYAIMSKL